MRDLCWLHNRHKREGLLFLLVDSSLQAFGLSANNNSSGTLYNSALQNLLGDRSLTGQAWEGSVFGAGDLQMINDFSQGELCPPPPMCCVLLPSLTGLFVREGGWCQKGRGAGDAGRHSLPIRRKMQEQEPCVGKVGMSYFYDYFCKNSNAVSISWNV